jgi:gas vesicle structural protein
MAIATQGTASNYLQRAPSPSGLADVVDLILDKGLVIDAYVRVALIGIELITIDARIVVASVDTYLRFAEAVNRLDLTQTELAGLPELTEKGSEKMAEGATEGALEGVQDKLAPSGSTARAAAKGVAAAAALGAAAVAARELSARVSSNGGGHDGDEDER